MSDERSRRQSQGGRNECVVHSYKILQIPIRSLKSCIFSEIRRNLANHRNRESAASLKEIGREQEIRQVRTQGASF